MSKKWTDAWDAITRENIQKQAEKSHFTAQEGSTLDRIWKGTFMNERIKIPTPHHLREWNIPIRVFHDKSFWYRQGDAILIQKGQAALDFYNKHKRYGYR